MRRLILLLVAALPAFAQCTGFANRIPVQYEAASANVSNDAAVVSITSKMLATVANGGLSQSSGFDICPSDLANTVAFPVQLRPGYSATTGAYLATVKIPGLAMAATNGYLWVGKASVTDPSTTGVWNANYVQVYPLQETCTPGGSTAGCFKDATAGANNSTSGVYPTEVAGLVGNAQSFNGTTSNIKFLNPITSGTAITMSAWFKTSFTTIEQSLVNNRNPNNGCILKILTSGFAAAWCNSAVATGSTNVADGAWHHMVLTLSVNTVKLYVDGAFITSTTGSFVGFEAGSLWVGMTPTSINFFNGQMQEVRISNVTLSAAQIKAEYDAMHAPATFFNLTNRTWGFAQ